MNILVKSRHTTPQHFEKPKYKGALIIDLTSRAPAPWVEFSPFYPHDNIPIPFSEGRFGASVEGIWQGLKVFETKGVDEDFFENRTMKKLKRTVRKYGNVKGHQKGTDSTELLSYLEARKQIYLPIYKWVLETKLNNLVEQLRKKAQENTMLILLDYETNGNVEDLRKPLSHAQLVKHYLEDNYPA